MLLFALSAELPFTNLLNRLLGGAATALLESLGIHPHDPLHPFTNWMAMQVLVTLLLIVFFALLRTRLSVDNPGAWQHLVETVHEFIENQSREMIGHHSEGFTPFLVALGLFIFSCNMIGLVPGFESPTANPAVPLGCAVSAFVYYNLQGIRRQGLVRYAAHFAGPMPWLAPLMFPIEIISHLARVLSLTIRLFANIFAGDMVTLVFFSLVPLGVPILFNGLHIGVSFLQAYIFVLLTTVYLSGAVAEEH